MNNVMFDIETLHAETSNAIVVQIALVVFDDNYNILDEFNVKIDPRAQKNREYSASTLEFWENQPKEVRNNVFSDQISPRQAAIDLIKFISGQGKLRFWSNHLLFDYNIVDSFVQEFLDVSLSDFFPYNSVEDYATIRNWFVRKLNEAGGGNYWRTFNEFMNEVIEVFTEESGEQALMHDAIYDCKLQIFTLKYIDSLIFDE